MKEVFNRVIPELADIINVQSCALFSVTDDLQHVVLEAGYPDLTGYHGVGKRFPISSEPAFELILNPGEPHEESPHEVITMSYLLVITPQKSALISKEVKRFADRHNINSILYVPLNVGQEITHFMTFDALDQRQRYTEEEIEIFLFLGRELMKAQKMERLDDILHDFKNPAIATAGFARRLKRLIEEEGPRDKESKIMRYLEILQEVGLGYLKLGQSLSTLSGGESQRLKIASELHKQSNIYIMDEPTTGLHMSDIHNFYRIVKSLVDQDNTVVIIEHNLDIIKYADWIIDMGPEGGKNGGEVVFQGFPEDIIKCKKSYTGSFLKNII